MSAIDPSRRLRRLARVREAEKLLAAGRLAASCATHDRLVTVANRARSILADCDPAHPIDAGSLRGTLNFRHGMFGVVLGASEEAQTADRQILAARQALAASERRLELARQRLTDAFRAQDAERAARD